MGNSLVRDSIQGAASWVDLSAMRLMVRRKNSSGHRPPPTDARKRLERLIEHYHPEGVPSEEFFAPPELPSVIETEVHGTGAVDLVLESRYRPYWQGYHGRWQEYAENHTCHARWYRAQKAGPTLICIHGWGGGAYWFEHRAFKVDFLRRRGIGVVLFQLPFHGRRRPKNGGGLFPSSDLIRTNEAFGQSIFDLRALRLYLRSRGVTSIGVAGMSLGGYTAALWASLDADLSCAVSMIPAVSMGELMWRHGSRVAVKERAASLGIGAEDLERVFRVHSPLARPPLVSNERLMIIAGASDRITPIAQANALAAHWNDPRMHVFPGGHVAQIGRRRAFSELAGHVLAMSR